MAHETFELRSPMPASAEDLYLWHSMPTAFARLVPPWETVTVTRTEGEFGRDGQRVFIRTAVIGPIKTTWEAEAFVFIPGREFRDRQISGPFAFWEHSHRMIPDGPTTSFLEDHMEYQLPVGALGRLFGAAMVRNRLIRMFAYRHSITASDLRRIAPYRDRPRLTIAITGSSGLIGSDLTAFLVCAGHTVVRLVRESPTAPDVPHLRSVQWNSTQPLDPKVLAGCEAVVHLAGDNVADGRWSAAKRQRIRDSRTTPTRHLAEGIAALPEEQRPRVLVSASAIGFYGDRGDEELTEQSPVGTGFFPDVCREWEAAANPAADAGVRVVHPRFGAVLSPKAGALGKQLAAFKAGMGAVLGSGKQWVPWVAVGDAVGAIHRLLMDDSLIGPVNVTSPNPVTNHDFTKTLGRVLGRPAVLWIPAPALRIMFGGIADAALLCSTRVQPTKLLASGFAFDHPDLGEALRFLLP